MTNIWTKIAGLSGASAIALGAVGAHALTKRSDGMKETWRVGNLYHLAHSIVLFQLSTLANVNPKKRKYACILFTGGILLFSGSCYTGIIFTIFIIIVTTTIVIIVIINLSSSSLSSSSLSLSSSS